jgi:uncharacterized protein YecE (DUF72 family)
VIRIGTSGWSYPHWRRDFYPVGLPQRQELSFLAERLPAIELNGTFYSLTLVASDTAGRYPLCLARTSDFAYVRLHGSTALYASRYEDAELAMWADRAAGWASAGADVFVYFDNDAHGHAPRDALRLQEAVRKRSG